MNRLCWWCEELLQPTDPYDTHDACADKIAGELDRELSDWGWIPRKSEETP